jgi:hypothetical protein
VLRGLAGRVGRLEIDRAEPCPECGWDGDWSNVEFVVEWEDLEGESSSEPFEPKWCETCGHQLDYIITWQDLEVNA